MFAYSGSLPEIYFCAHWFRMYSQEEISDDASQDQGIDEVALQEEVKEENRD